MSVYARFKRNPDGFRQVVELWETTPIDRRQRMIDVGMAEDPEYTRRILEFVMTFEDILKLGDLELAELMAVAPPRFIALAIQRQPEEVINRFLRNAKGPVISEVREYLDSNATLRDIGGAQLKLVGEARKLERKGLVKAKRIPLEG